MADLKRCPFCGGEAKVGKMNATPAFLPAIFYNVYCTECKVTTTYVKENEEAAKDLWNRRVSDNEEV